MAESLKGRQEYALIQLAHVKSLLAQLAEPDGFPPIVDAAGWRAIDAAERKAGEAAGAVRVKLETRGELFAAAAASRA